MIHLPYSTVMNQAQPKCKTTRHANTYLCVPVCSKIQCVCVCAYIEIVCMLEYQIKVGLIV